MTDKKVKKIPWGWIILFVIVVLYFFASYMREHRAVEGPPAVASHSQIPSSLQEALTPEAKKAASQEHSQGLSYEPSDPHVPPVAIEDLPAESLPPEDKQLKAPPTHTGAQAVISPIDEKSTPVDPHSLSKEPAIVPQQKSIPEGGGAAPKKDRQPLSDNRSVALPGWTVQVAAFNEVESAQRLVRQLRQKHLPAYEVQQSLASGQSVIRVYVGPVLQRQQAEQLRHTVQQQAMVKGMVVTYEPVLQAPLQVS